LAWARQARLRPMPRLRDVRLTGVLKSRSSTERRQALRLQKQEGRGLRASPFPFLRTTFGTPGRSFCCGRGEPG
jgi:hypothetical protein